jgi:hypothetical protein
LWWPSSCGGLGGDGGVGDTVIFWQT